MTDIKDRGYSRPEVLVSTDWVTQHLNDLNVRVVESNEDPLLYPARHIAGAVEVDWTKDLNDQLRRDYLGRSGFETLMSRIGCTRDTTVVFYGDKNNWWACYAFWVFHLFGHTAAKVMDGGSLKWEKEGRPMTKEVPKYPSSQYRAPERDDTRIRAYRDQVMSHVKGTKPLVDVRSPEEYACGHITGAVNVSLSEMTEETLAKIIPLKNTKIIIYCNNSLQTMPTRMISMTTQAYPTLYQLGYQNLYLLQDGYKSSKGALSRIPLELSADAMQKCRFLAELKGKPKP